MFPNCDLHLLVSQLCACWKEHPEDNPFWPSAAVELCQLLAAVVKSKAPGLSPAQRSTVQRALAEMADAVAQGMIPIISYHVSALMTECFGRFLRPVPSPF